MVIAREWALNLARLKADLEQPVSRAVNARHESRGGGESRPARALEFRKGKRSGGGSNGRSSPTDSSPSHLRRYAATLTLRICRGSLSSLLVRGIEPDMLSTPQRHGIGVIARSPLAGGWLSGRWRKGAEPPISGRPAREPQRYDLSLPANQRKFGGGRWPGPAGGRL